MAGAMFKASSSLRLGRVYCDPNAHPRFTTPIKLHPKLPTTQSEIIRTCMPPSAHASTYLLAKRAADSNRLAIPGGAHTGVRRECAVMTQSVWIVIGRLNG